MVDDLQPSQQCPLCQSNNRCTGNHQCWCINVSIPENALAAIPAEAKNKQCICPECVAKFAATAYTDATEAKNA